MEIATLGSSCTARHFDDSGLEVLQFREEIQRIITAPTENTRSFTALLELPPTQVMELLHSQDTDAAAEAASIPGEPIQPQINELKPYPLHNFNGNLTFPTNAALIERASKYSVFSGGSSPVMEETSSVPSDTSENLDKVKNEPTETGSYQLPQPLRSDPTLENQNQRAAKRKEREKKVKGTTKKNKSVGDETSGDRDKPPYVHVRVRRGQATDSHSLAERARREKINARMKLLQELVPGCNKISGTALVLDEIINHVQSLQRQVEFLSMKLAAVNPRIDFNLDSLLAIEGPLLVDGSFTNLVPPAEWSDMSVSGSRQQCQPYWQFDAFHQQIWGKEDHRSFITQENSFLTFDSSANSATLHSNQLKMEL